MKNYNRKRVTKNNQIRKLYYFFISYKGLCWFTLIALVISVAYYPIFDLLEFQLTIEQSSALKFLKNAITWLDGIALAIIANCLFCYFQVFIPNYKQANIFIDDIELNIEGVLYQMTERLKIVYLGTMNRSMNFENMTREDFSTFVKKINFNQHHTGPNIIYSSATYLDELVQGINHVQKIVDRIISNYGSHLDTELINILIKIKENNYVNVIRYLNGRQMQVGELSVDTCERLADELYKYKLNYTKLKNHKRLIKV